MKICSFATAHDSMLMWGHYGDKQKGMCIAYDTVNLSDARCADLYPVIYSDEMFNTTEYFVTAIEGKTPFNIFYGILAAIHKSSGWAYENEWRLVLPMGVSSPNENVAFGKPAHVYLGSRTSQADLEAVLSLCRAKGVACSRMELAPSRFALEARTFDRPGDDIFSLASHILLGPIPGREPCSTTR